MQTDTVIYSGLVMKLLFTLLYSPNHNQWDVIINGDLEEEHAPTTGETSAPPAPKTAKQLAARRNQERVKSILLLAIPDENTSLSFTISLPSSWNQIALIMRNKPDIDEIDIDDLYNNLRVYEDELKRSSGSNSTSQNLAFLSSENIGSTNEVSTASGDFWVSTAGGINQVPSTPCAHDVAYSFLVQPTTSPQLENEDFQQIDGDDLEELDLRWQSNAPTNESSSQALVAQDGLGGYDWSNDFKVEPVNYALMEISSSSSSSSSNSKFKERDEIKDKIAKWEESSKNLDEILNSQMSAKDKIVSSDEENTPENDRFLKNGYKAVPPPITGNFLTPKADISFAGLDEYAISNKIIESQTIELNTKTSDTVGKTNNANTEKPKSVSESVMSNPKINRDSVIIEDWHSDDEEEAGVLTRTSLHRPSVSTARPSVSTARPVCTDRPSVSTARPVSTVRPSVSTARPICTAKPSVSTARPVYATRHIYPRMDNVRPRGSCSPIKRSYYTKLAFKPKDLKQDVKTFRVQNMNTAGIRAVVNTGKGKLDTDFKKSRWV
ncbi:hypothetical protein Tco_1391694 [Tanacetum coccineum]